MMTVIDLSPSLPVSQRHANVQGLVSLLLLDESPETVIHCLNLKRTHPLNFLPAALLDLKPFTETRHQSPDGREAGMRVAALPLRGEEV